MAHAAHAHRLASCVAAVCAAVFAALAAFYEAGIRVPADVRLVTLANNDYGPVFPRPLTRMEFDTSEIGKAMTGSILSYLQTGEFPQGIVVGPKYVRGETF